MSISYKGKILISTPDASGDIFSRSVILVIEHNPDGAFGLILNKRNSKVSAHFKNYFDQKIEVYEGGPVENDKIFFIAKGEKLSETYTEINDQFYLTDDVEKIIDAVIGKRFELENLKIFSGYSGWSSNQLEREIQNKMWTVVDIYNLDYTLPNDQKLWKSIMQNLGGEFLLWANAPENISMN